MRNYELRNQFNEKLLDFLKGFKGNICFLESDGNGNGYIITYQHFRYTAKGFENFRLGYIGRERHYVSLNYSHCKKRIAKWQKEQLDAVLSSKG